jgi:hypothetical protein
VDAPDRLRAAHDFLEPIVERLNLPRRASDSVRRIVSMLPKLESVRAHRFKKSPQFSVALEVFAMRQRATGKAFTLPLDDEQPVAAGRGRKGRARRKPTRR